MNVLIGIKGSEQIRYITLESAQSFRQIVNILKNFYRTPERVNTLIDLGNLYRLGITPCNKCKGEDDLINCDSKIRDRKLSTGKHGSQRVPDEKEITEKLHGRRENLNCCFLYENDNWFVLVGGHKENIRTVDETVLSKNRLMEGLKVYVFEADDKYNRLPEKTFYSWDNVRQSADETGKTYFIFRGEKFLTIIPPSSQKQDKNNDLSNPQSENTIGQAG